LHDWVKEIEMDVASILKTVADPPAKV